MTKKEKKQIRAEKALLKKKNKILTMVRLYLLNQLMEAKTQYSDVLHAPDQILVKYFKNIQGILQGKLNPPQFISNMLTALKNGEAFSLICYNDNGFTSALDEIFPGELTKQFNACIHERWKHKTIIFALDKNSVFMIKENNTVLTDISLKKRSVVPFLSVYQRIESQYFFYWVKSYFGTDALPSEKQFSRFNEYIKFGYN